MEPHQIHEGECRTLGCTAGWEETEYHNSSEQPLTLPRYYLSSLVS